MKAWHRTASVLVGLSLSTMASGVAAASTGMTIGPYYKHTRTHQATYHVDPPQGQCCAYYVDTYQVCSQELFPAPGPDNCHEEDVRSTNGSSTTPSVDVTRYP